MNTPNRLSEIVDDYIRHADADYVGLWQIASRIRLDLELDDGKRVEQQTLIVVRQLVDRGLLPGDYFKSGFNFWNEDDTEAIVARIKKEWDFGHGDPTLANPICWFAPRPKYVIGSRRLARR